jgi:transcriptional regulator GlxA family with amidase domain
MQNSAPRTICFVVFPGFELLDLGGPRCAFHLASGGHHARYDVQIVSATGGLIDAAGGVGIQTALAPDSGFVDTVVAVGGPAEHVVEGDAGTICLIKVLAARARRKASVCTGAFLLAAAGLLDGHRATTHWRYSALLQRRFPMVRVEADRIFVQDGDIWTSAGITAGIDLALAMIEDDCGPDVSKAIARDLVMHHRRAGGQSQFSTMLELEPPSGRIKNALMFAREHLNERLSVARLADVACISPRQFARLFLAETGETPARAIERLRVEAAVPRVQNGSESIHRIASDTGFGDLERMRAAFLRIYGHPPQDLRRAALRATRTPSGRDRQSGFPSGLP